MTGIGRLIDIAPRDAWSDEARDFTPWLADHLDGLGEVLGILLEYEDREVSVETYSADIIARDPTNDTRVLIENQLEKSDHKHLGQIMTYLAGLDAQVIVWVATQFTEPHLAAIKWLNEHTVEPFAFFAVKLRVVRIGDSLPAPIFEVAERPNTWERQMQAAAREPGVYATFRRAFWSAFLDRHPQDAGLGVAVTGRSNCYLSTANPAIWLSIFLDRRGVGMFLRPAKDTTNEAAIDLLSPIAGQLATRLGEQPWAGMQPTANGAPGHYLGIFRSADMADEDTWPDAIDWAHERAHAYLHALADLLPGAHE